MICINFRKADGLAHATDMWKVRIYFSKHFYHFN